jgi:hypothetical protein
MDVANSLLGWIFLVVSWIAITGVTMYCFWRVMKIGKKEDEERGEGQAQ